MACSPDLNPIEHLWDQLGREVRAHITPNHTRPSQAIPTKINELPQAMIKTDQHHAETLCMCTGVVPPQCIDSRRWTMICVRVMQLSPSVVWANRSPL